MESHHYTVNYYTMLSILKLELCSLIIKLTETIHLFRIPIFTSLNRIALFMSKDSINSIICNKPSQGSNVCKFWSSKSIGKRWSHPGCTVCWTADGCLWLATLVHCCGHQLWFIITGSIVIGHQLSQLFPHFFFRTWYFVVSNSD